MIHEFCSPGGWADLNGLDYEYCKKCIRPINRLIKFGRDKKIPILWLNWGLTDEEVADLPKNQLMLWKKNKDETGLEAGLFRLNSKRVEVIPDLDKQEEDISVRKVRMTGFYNTDLDNKLKSMGIGKLIFAGVNTDQCVISTMADANFIGYECIMITDCCATNSPPYAEKGAIYNAAECLGEAIDLEELIKRI